MTWLERVTWASPTLVRGMSVLPVWRPLIDHSVCPADELDGCQGFSGPETEELVLDQGMEGFYDVPCLIKKDRKSVV